MDNDPPAAEEYGNRIGSKNVYVCELCKKSLCTVHVDTGVTPFMVPCKRTPGCKGFMRSGFYHPTRLTPVAEWYKPAADDWCMKNEAVKQHVDSGGLMLRMKPDAAAILGET